ncbi:MAG: substrate-binding domain-containing protein [Candidatus Paceibacterota bacterium]|jgi:D-xylose transport system substrate-binding protein
MNKKIFLIFILIAVIVGICVGLLVLFNKLPSDSSDTGNTMKENIRIGFSLGTSQEERWQKDVSNFVERAKELEAIVEVKYSGEDPKLQISQAENLIIGGVKVLVVVANDSASASQIVDMAHKAGIKVIAYDRMIDKSDVDLYVTFDSREIGKLQAQEVLNVSKGSVAYIGGSPTDNNALLLKEGTMKILDPLIKNKSAKLVVDSFSLGWQPEEAYKTIHTYLASGKKIDAVIAANDGTAGGVIKALKEYGLAGKVPVSGQDADLVACQRVIAGTQTMTVYKSLKKLAYAAAEAAVVFAEGNTPKINGTINNGKNEVPSYFLTPILVTKENMDTTVIADGFHTQEEVYGKSL